MGKQLLVATCSFSKWFAVDVEVLLIAYLWLTTCIDVLIAATPKSKVESSEAQRTEADKPETSSGRGKWCKLLLVPSHRLVWPIIS